MATSDVGKFLSAYHPERRLQEIYSEGDLPPNRVRRPSDASVVSSRVDNYNYGINLVRDHRSASLQQQQNPSWDKFIGGAFGPNDGPGCAEVGLQDLQLDSDGGDTTMDEQIHEAMQSTAPGPSRPWLPFGDLQRFTHRTRVNKELQEVFSKADAARLTDYVCGIETNSHTGGETSQRIFVILVLIRRLEALSAMEEDGLRDKDLPFEWLDRVSRKKLISPKSPFARDPLPCFKGKGIGLVREFYENQWKILSPIIGLDEHEEVTTFHLAEEVIMPWTFIGAERKEGGFSMVRKVEIHSDHHSFPEHKAFALKTLLEKDPAQAQQEFDQELKALTKMEPGDHILKLCATFKIGNEYSFLTPWAEGGNLKQFWTKSPKQVQKTSKHSHTLLRWMAEQCHALAAALQSIHEVRVKALIRAKRISSDEETDKDIFGIHGDIKPENILLFDNRDTPPGIGILKIADFGLTEFHRLTSRTRPVRHFLDGRHPGPTYDAPDLVQPSNFYSRKADVWALGCVFSEFLTWVVCGSTAVSDYRSARAGERDWDEVKKKHRWTEDKFFVARYGEESKVETSLKDSVEQWLKTLDDLTRTSTNDGPNFVTEFSKLLKDRVLVCDREKRISCEDLLAELSGFASKAKESRSNDLDHYWGPPLPSFCEASPEVSETVTPEIARRVTFDD